MTLDAVNGAIRTHYDDTHNAIPTEHDNHPIAHPDDAIWVRFSILPGENSQVSIGASTITKARTRRVGVAMAQIFGPLNGGDAAVITVADAIEATFRRKTVGGPSLAIQFRTPTIVRIGRRDDAWQVNVSCPFFVDEIV